ncbi:hypothetical protein PoB_000104800 [Plakobranchus ocellatus]|uniref:Uncharacterized protein n=1 Tax=Plakobranchus ocellatus TaxID=259542 RepID=A0AAV3XX27_9GAST|nr:hypothetical protein PoB_000104800 [Plakobranchus ocellatus]
MIYRNELKEIGPSEASPKVDDACLKVRGRSKVFSCLNASYEDQNGHDRQQTPGRASNGLGVLCAVTLKEYHDQKENGPQNEHKQVAVESEDAHISVSVKREV